ncbi:MAG TPA: ribosome biogenesis GTPase Der, partial [Clostridiales bacterium]|nr:ribosome biogenesis GTPase Der [Clostridiales bacterium]
MERPIVAVVGRPNVGKSTFFNRIAGKKISIVKDMPGVTRDRIYADAEWCGHNFTIVDTGGLDVKNKDDFQQNITRQAELAVELAQVVLLFVDGKEGLLPADYDAANFLRKYKVPIVLVVNKIDNNELEKTYEFYNLGLGEPVAISAELNKGIGDLLDIIVSKFDRKVEDKDLSERIKIAVVGKPNAGKSSLVNRLLGENRVMVSNVAGTTRDAIDTPFRYNGKDYLLIDTAGIRRKRSIDKDSVELYSVIRSFDAIRRADIVVLVVDSVDGLSEQDVRIAGFIHEEGKPSIILMNKWDAVEKDSYSMNKFNDKLNEDLKFMDYFVALYGSALTGLRINKLMETVDEVLENAGRRITTGNLNDILQNAILTNEPPTKNGRR